MAYGNQWLNSEKQYLSNRYHQFFNLIFQSLGTSFPILGAHNFARLDLDHYYTQFDPVQLQFFGPCLEHWGADKIVFKELDTLVK